VAVIAVVAGVAAAVTVAAAVEEEERVSSQPFSIKVKIWFGVASIPMHNAMKKNVEIKLQVLITWHKMYMAVQYHVPTTLTADETPPVSNK
jgi:hypothetical protein